MLHYVLLVLPCIVVVDSLSRGAPSSICTIGQHSLIPVHGGKIRYNKYVGPYEIIVNKYEYMPGETLKGS